MQNGLNSSFRKQLIRVNFYINECCFIQGSAGNPAALHKKDARHRECEDNWSLHGRGIALLHAGLMCGRMIEHGVLSGLDVWGLRKPGAEDGDLRIERL
jgi:hypothetical protein